MAHWQADSPSLQPRHAASRRPPRWGQLTRWALVFLLAIMVSGCIFGTIDFMRFKDAIATIEPKQVPQVDGIVVLTGGSQRVQDAVALLAARHGRKLLVSGVHERTGREELARHVRGARDLLDCCVDLGKGARNTIGNAIEARRWVQSNGFTSLLVVTSNYHLPRTLMEFRHALPGVRIVGHPVVSDMAPTEHIWRDPDMFRLMMLEYGKFMLARLRHMVEGDPEHSRWPVLVGRQKPVGPQPIERAQDASP